MGERGLESAGTGQNLVSCCSERNERIGSIKDEEFLDQLKGSSGLWLQTGLIPLKFFGYNFLCFSFLSLYSPKHIPIVCYGH
jgi:hypothetical protein